VGLDGPHLLALAALVLAVGVLYASVGHAGASGYLAAMALFGVAPALMKPVALTLNLLVAVVATYRFRSAGHFRARLLWPFAVGSVPLAFVGGRLHLDAGQYRVLLGLVLFVAAARMVMRLREPDGGPKPPPPALGVALGAAVGFLSGLVGVGGGIFLSPILLLAGWAGTRQTAAVSAPFILVNSAAGLAGTWSATSVPPAAAPVLAAAALCGGLVGAELGSRRLPPRALRSVLAVVLLLAGVKLVMGWGAPVSHVSPGAGLKPPPSRVIPNGR
jgi:uncharacterized protein